MCIRDRSCIYCSSSLSSSIQQEEKRFGKFSTEGVELVSGWTNNIKIKEQTDLLFKWFEKHIHKLHKIFVMGGEPFLQKETFRYIEFLEKGNYPDLTLVFFSNHNIEHERFKKWMDRLDVLQKSGRLDKIQIFFSCDVVRSTNYKIFFIGGDTYATSKSFIFFLKNKLILLGGCSNYMPKYLSWSMILIQFRIKETLITVSYTHLTLPTKRIV
mgnify:CR=1 FL=1